MTSRILFPLLPFAAAFFLAAQEPGATPASPAPSAAATQSAGESVSVHENIQYGLPGGQDLLLDIYEPPGQSASATPRPAVVLIHGGSWMIADKSTMRGMAQFLARCGFVAASVNYRLLHRHDNRWPAQLDDVQRSVRWLRANAAKYNVNPDRIGAFGHSAGAQLAALLGMEDTRDNSDPELAKYSSRVNAVVDVSGPTDFTKDHDRDGDALLANLLGADYSKDPEAWREASPVFHVSPSAAPFLIVHGTRDPDVSIGQSQELYEKLQQAGVPVTFVKVDDVHTFQTPEARHRLAIETLAFFNRYLVIAR